LKGLFGMRGAQTRAAFALDKEEDCMKRQTPGSVWAIVLAAGEGSRMAPLTRALYGHDLPKQFAALDGDRTLLQQTMNRIAPVTPPERTVVVVAEGYYDLACQQLADYRGVEIVAQPRNVGTGPGILLPLAHVLARDPEADVAVYPSDHHVRRTEPFVEAVERARTVARAAESGLALLGAAAERPATDLGWIMRGQRIGGQLDRAWKVHRFIEKPPESLAMLLLGAGSLWNTMVLVSRARALWALSERHIPAQTRAFADYVAALRAGTGVRAAREALYCDLAPADFSREVLQVAEGLAVVPLIDSGWFDCGTPERLFEWLKASPEMASMLARIQSAVARSGPRPAAPPSAQAHAAA
jgi:mannose-1-phosphate guanylyltransferase